MKPRLQFIALALAVLVLPADAGAAPDKIAHARAATTARQAFDARANAYWQAVLDKRRARMAKRRNGQPIGLQDYVLTQPPVYDGPTDPADPSKAPPPRPRKYVPTIADFLQSASQNFQFVPRRPASEMEFKRAYARAVLAEGLTADQVIRIYAFETGGLGFHDTQAGLLNAKPQAKPISAALGYNQLLVTYSIHLLADFGEDFVDALQARLGQDRGAEREATRRRIASLKRMIALARSVPANWNAQERLGETQQGWAIQALLLDADIGPLMQARKMFGSIRFARMRGHHQPLTAAELQMMNLMGDGSGLDVATMPQAMREQVPTSNFFQRGGYERNAIVRKYNTVDRLLAATDERIASGLQQPGSRELAAAF